ncbi:MAG: hypothetical protein HWE10_02830, partial [Gammaproteobacteria bacterium]|nr:hypothetical protein [Gammaproteobacteria bacterium]
PEPEPQVDESALLAQQAFYQDMADSQGFAPEYDGAYEAYDSESVEQNLEQPSEPVAESSQGDDKLPKQQASEAIKQHPSSITHDSPVLAILAARGLDTEQPISQIQSSFEPEPEVEEDNQPKPIELKPAEDLKPLEHEEVRFAYEVDQWASLIERSGLAGLTRQLALQSAPVIDDTHIVLTVKKEYAHLLNERTESELHEVVARLSPEREFVINKSEIAEHSPAALQQNINENRQERAEQSIHADPFVQTLLQEFDGRLVEESIKPL